MSVNLWTDPEIALLEALRPYLNTREIKQVLSKLGFDRTMEAISKKARMIGTAFKDFGVPAMQGLSEEEKAAINEVLSTREVKFAEINPPYELSPSKKAQQTMALKETTAKLMASMQEVRDVVPKRSSISTKRASGKKESLVLLISDNHFGATIQDDDMEFLYNVQIAEARVGSTFDLAMQRLGEEKANNIDEVVIVLAGDHVDGEGVYPGQEMNLETHVAEQVKRATKAFWGMIKQFRERFPMVRVVTTRGNHGRGGTSPESNWDIMIYQQLEVIIDIEDDPNLTIKNRYGNYNIVDVKGHRGMVRHKAPVQADTASAIAKYAGWNGIHDWDFFLFGHWHHWGVLTWNGKPIYRNGSAMGGNDYAENFGAYDKPAQMMFTVSEEEIGTAHYTIQYE